MWPSVAKSGARILVRVKESDVIQCKAKQCNGEMYWTGVDAWKRMRNLRTVFAVRLAFSGANVVLDLLVTLLDWPITNCILWNTIITLLVQQVVIWVAGTSNAGFSKRAGPHLNSTLVIAVRVDCYLKLTVVVIKVWNFKAENICSELVNTNIPLGSRAGGDHRWCRSRHVQQLPSLKVLATGRYQYE